MQTFLIIIGSLLTITFSIFLFSKNPKKVGDKQKINYNKS